MLTPRSSCARRASAAWQPPPRRALQPPAVGARQAGESRGATGEVPSRSRRPSPQEDHAAADRAQVAPRDPDRPHERARPRVRPQEHLETAVHGPPRCQTVRARPRGRRRPPGRAPSAPPSRARGRRPGRRGRRPRPRSRARRRGRAVGSSSGAMLPTASVAGAPRPRRPGGAEVDRAVDERACGGRCPVPVPGQGDPSRGSPSGGDRATIWSSFGSTASAGISAAATPRRRALDRAVVVGPEDHVQLDAAASDELLRLLAREVMAAPDDRQQRRSPRGSTGSRPAPGASRPPR